MATARECTTDDLVQVALGDPESNETWEAISELHIRGTRLELDAAMALVGHAEPSHRAVGASMLGQLGAGQPSFVEESVALLHELLSDPADEVVAAATYGLGHRRQPESLSMLVGLARHGSAAVREAVAFALGGHDEPDVLVALLGLMGDPNQDVRNWATFGVGSLCDVDNPAIRAALLERTGDDFADARGEALVGLARRRDAAVWGPLLKELEGPFYGDWAIEAAVLMPHPSLIGALEALERRLGEADRRAFGEALQRALIACRGFRGR